MKNYWTIKDISEMTGYPVDSCWRFCREKKLTCEKINNAVYLIEKSKANEAFLKFIKNKREKK